MKKRIIIIWVLFVSAYACYAQEPANFDSEPLYYVDYLPENTIPPAFYRHYYRTAYHSFREKRLQAGDPFSPRIRVFLSRQSQGGYLSINLEIGEEIRKLNRTDIKVIYVYEGKEVRSKADVMRIVRLKNKNLGFYYVLYDPSSHTITAKIRRKTSPNYWFWQRLLFNPYVLRLKKFDEKSDSLLWRKIQHEGVVPDRWKPESEEY